MRLGWPLDVVFVREGGWDLKGSALALFVVEVLLGGAFAGAARLSWPPDVVDVLEGGWDLKVSVLTLLAVEVRVGGFLPAVVLCGLLGGSRAAGPGVELAPVLAVGFPSGLLSLPGLAVLAGRLGTAAFKLPVGWRFGREGAEDMMKARVGISV